MSKHQPIEPKPTQYGNVLFRSRLEARWAVFLDFTENVLNWEYEPKTFKLRNGWEYTPDFRAKLFRDNKSPITIYIEVKPLQATKQYRDNLMRFVAQHRIVLVLAEGDFYDGPLTVDTLCITTANAAKYAADTLFRNHERGVYHARHFRFDLKG